MSDPTLLAETPRAGTLGHRFLVPIDLEASETEAAAFVQIVGDGISVGKNFIAIASRVTQQNGSGTVRTGRELVVLAGVDVLQLSGGQFAQLVLFLQDALSKLERLVTNGIDWTRASTLEVILRRQELQQWLGQLRTLSWPTTEWRGGPLALNTADLPCSQPAVKPLNNRKLQNVLLAVAACAFASVAVAFYLYLSRDTAPINPELTWRNNPIAVDVGAQQISSESESIRELNGNADANESPSSPPLDHTTAVISLLRNAIAADKVDVIVEVLSLLDRETRGAELCWDAIVEYGSQLVKSERFDDGARVLQAISKCSDVLNVDSKTSARVADLQRKADEGCESIDQSDRNLYEAVRSSTGKLQLEAARTYLASGPRPKNMSPAVRRWLDWVEKPISAEVTSVNLPADGNLIIRIASNDHEVARKIDRDHLVTSGQPLKLMLTPLGITNHVEQSSVSVIVETENIGFSRAPLRFEGNLHVGKQSRSDTRINLVSYGLPQQKGTLDIRFRGFEAAPTLPDWTKTRP